MAEQLTFDLPVRPALGRDDFFVSPANALALAALDGWRDWPQGKMVLTGPAGAGKSHLAQVWAAESGAQVIAAADLAPADAASLVAGGHLAIEDAEVVAGDSALETALFHLHNLALATGTGLLLTARSAPSRWGIVLPDLASRLEATATVAVAPPDDALLSAVLAKLLADRQIAAPLTLVPYLVGRMERSFAAARRLVADLDARALSQARPVGRALAAEVLDSMGHDTP